MILADIDIRALCTLCPEDFSKRSAALSGIDLPEHPMLSPFSESTSGTGIVSSGLSHSGYDLRLGHELWIMKSTHAEVVNPKRFKDTEYVYRVFDKITPADGSNQHVPKGSFVLPPHSFALGASIEYVWMPSRIMGQIIGKSTLARAAVFINCTPIEAGWHGHITIEIHNLCPNPTLVFSGEGIAQMLFHMITTSPERDYSKGGAKYQGQKGITPARAAS